MALVFASFLAPLVISFQYGATYAFGFGVCLAGIAMYILNGILIGHYIRRRAPWVGQNEDLAMATAGTGIVPKWVSAVGLIGTGIALGGIMVPALMFLGVL